MADTLDDSTSDTEGEPETPAIVLLASPARVPRAWPPPITLGRELVDDEHLSRAHARVDRTRGTWLITDLGSRNGTFVDGDRITGTVARSGDAILRAGHCVLALLADGRGHPAHAGHPVVGPELGRAYALITSHAGGATILLHGESGSGKELAARLYHDAGPRRAGPFVALNCAAIPEGVAERLLFGSRVGAFSGAVDAPGHFQQASGGTLFLDEIAELAPIVQAKLLRAIETREVMPVGAARSIQIDCGVVAASHGELRAAVADRRFREDMYYRLAAATITLPPLRARKADIARLVEHELSAVDPALWPHAKLVEACCLRPWPGNIRELRAAVRHASLLARSAGRCVVRLDDLAPEAGLAIERDPIARDATAPGELDRDTVVAAIDRANGVLSVAARALGLHRTQLYRLLDKLGIARS